MRTEQIFCNGLSYSQVTKQEPDKPFYQEKEETPEASFLYQAGYFILFYRFHSTYNQATKVGDAWQVHLLKAEKLFWENGKMP
jgi:hypothetical protein